MDLREFFNYLKRMKWIIIITFAVCTLCSGLFTYFNKVTYLSTPKIIIGPQTYVSKDGKFSSNLVYVISDLLENEKLLTRLASETGINKDKETLKSMLSTNVNDQHQRVFLIVRGGDSEEVRIIAQKLPDIVAETAKELFNIDNLMVIKSDKVVAEGKSYKRNMVSGAVGGIGLGFLIIFVLLIFDDKIRNRNAISNIFTIDNLGIINTFKTDKKSKMNNLSLLCTTLLLKINVKSVKILANICLTQEKDNIYTVTNNIARLGKKILLVDFSKKPEHLSAVDAKKVEYGLYDIICGSDGDINRAVFKADDIDMMILGSEGEISMPMLVSRKMKDALYTLTEKYDLVIFNLPIEVGMEKILAASYLCEGALLSIKEGHTRMADVESVISSLKGSGTSIFGYYTQD